MKHAKLPGLSDTRIAVIGLGYVGLPLAVEFSNKYQVVGYDIDEHRIKQLTEGIDATSELSFNEMQAIGQLRFSSVIDVLKECNVFIVTVPTPIDSQHKPDLSPLINASALIGRVISRGSVVIYESTVYPGVTEDECVPVLEEFSGQVFNRDFYAGYSPERINPGDKSRRLKDILKVTSGSTSEAAKFIDDLYSSIITAGTFRATSIKVAEASKVIENVQRDVNIALINELHQVFRSIGLNTHDVIDAASTKWNFMRLTPGLVGGHCIGVDPYYLLHKSQASGYIPDLIRTAREINNSMASFFARDFVNELLIKKINPIDLDVVILGFTFKPNCPDIRNTKVYDLFVELNKAGFNVSIFDPHADARQVFEVYGIQLVKDVERVSQSVAIIAVEHSEILNLINEFKFSLVYELNKNVV